MLWAFAGCWALLAVGYFVARWVVAARGRACLWADLEGFLADAAAQPEVENIVRMVESERDDDQP